MNEQAYPGFLAGLAQDVLEHGACEGCKINAAMGLDALGLLDDVLRRSGVADPRPPEVPVRPHHEQPQSPSPADPRQKYEVRLTLSVPGETVSDAKRTLRQLVADLGGLILDADAVLHGVVTTGLLPESGDQVDS